MTLSSQKNPIHAPLSWSQQGLWILEQLDVGLCTYNVGWAFRINGHLDVEFFNRAFQYLVKRHSVLRTVFSTEISEPVQQVILPEMTISIPCISIENSPESEQLTEVKKCFSKETSTPFNLATGPLLRGTLLRTSHEEHYFILGIHHIVTDGWSLGIMLKEVAHIYQQLIHGRTPELPDLPLEYYEYATKQVAKDAELSLAKGYAYWEKQLALPLPKLELPIDFPRTSHSTNQGARCFFTLSPQITEQIRAACKKERVTPFTFLLTVFKILLYRYTGQGDLLIASPVANRFKRDLGELLGFFVNTLGLRSDYSDNPTFPEALAREQSTMVNGMRYMDVPLGEIVRRINPERSAGFSQIFQVMFILQNIPVPDYSFGDLKINPVNVDHLKIPELNWIQNDNGWSKFDLTLELTSHQGGQFVGAFEYNTSLFTEETILIMRDRFLLLLQSVLMDSTKKITDFPFLLPREKNLFREWNNTSVDFSQDLTLIDLFARQVSRSPEATALVFAEKSLTYRELDLRANQLANYLQGNGVLPDTLVAVCMERSLEMVVTILAILKSGGAYLPIDPSYPENRLSYMLTDSNSRIVITSEHILGRIPEYGARVICVDRDQDLIAACPQITPETTATPENLAYVIYTSGSTGRPKGVMISRRAITNHMQWLQTAHPMGQNDAVLQKTPFSFDASVWEFYASLLTGGRLIMARQDGHKDPDYLIKTIKENSITILQLVPSLLSLLLEQQTFAECTSLKKVFCGGEPLAPTLVSRFYKMFPSSAIYNLYGPTEATINATCGYCHKDNKVISIGKPVANCQAFILDNNLRLLPVGVAGELHIGGAGLARGYLNRPELTAEKFIHISDHKIWDEPIRLYKTGDLASWLPNGNIQYIGRTDHQIKLRGFRIELGEIESAISQSGLVRENVVVDRDDGAGSRRLVAYVVTETSYSETGGEISKQLRELLARRLPEYMIPSLIVELESLPLTPNGKVDRNGLPEPGRRIEVDYIAPGSSLEHDVVAVWEELLGVTGIGLTDNFFDLGGHSLITVRLLARIKKNHGLDIPLSHFFKNPTIQGMTLAIENGQDFVPAGSLISLEDEAVLASEIRAEGGNVVPLEAAEDIFITGVTGFVGAFLLKELLDKTTARIHCLVRARTLDQAGERIRKGLQFFKLWNLQDESRIIPVLGDLAADGLGIDAKNLVQLQKNVDIIYHNGAFVHHMLPYSRLKSANVHGTHEVLRLACTGKLKMVHFISTLDIFSSSVGQTPCLEKTETDQEQHQESKGYAASKWVAEKLVTLAGERGIPARIYRLGLVTGDSRTGACNGDDHMDLFIRSCIKLGCFPADLPPVQVVPVNILSEAIVYLTKQQELNEKIFHLFNPNAVSADKILEGYSSNGQRLKKIAADRWFSLVEKTMETEQPLPIVPYLPMYKKFLADYVENGKEQQAQYNCRATLEYLKYGDIQYPELSGTILSAYYGFLTQRGLI